MILNSDSVITKVSSFWKWFVAILIVGLSVFLFWNTFFIGFIRDDWGELGNARAASWDVLFHQLSPFSTNWRVMYYFWWKALFIEAGVSPIPYHVVHFIQHFICTLWVYFFVRFCAKSERAALIAVLFFSFNRVMCGPVAWDSAIIDSFIVLFGIPTFFFYIFASRSKKLLPKIVWYLLCYFFALLTLKSKLAAITFPVVLILYEMFWGGKGWVLKTIRRQWPIWIIYLIFLVSMIPDLKQGSPGYEKDMSLFGYWKGLLWYVSSPMGQEEGIRMEAYHSFFPIAVALGLFGTSLYYFKKNRALLYGCLWFMIGVFPMAVLITHHYDHHLYYPFVGGSLLIGVLLDEILLRLSKSKSGWSRPAFQVGILGALFGLYLVVMVPLYSLEHTELTELHEKNERTLSDLRAMFPVMPDHAHFYFRQAPAAGLMDNGWAVNILWNKTAVKSTIIPDSKTFQNAINGDPSVPDGDRFHPETERLIVMDYDTNTGAVTDITKQYQKP